MNRIYALVWNESKRTWVVAREGVRRRGKSRSGARLAATGIALLSLSALGTAHALPTGGQIKHGDATITSDGAQMVIQQHTDKLVTDWTHFNISAGHGVRFQQPGKDSVALNKVIGAGSTQISGALDANGSVFLINPMGVVFNHGAQVNVGGLVASVQPIQDADFISGNYVFSGNGKGPVENFGSITAHEGGAVALLSPYVNNRGIIRAELGTIALAAGEAFTLTFQGNQLLNLQIDRGTAHGLLANKNLLQANGGQVLLKAQAADAILGTVINNEGIIEANTLNGTAGRITLDGGTQGVKVAGILSARAFDAKGDGGVIDTRGHTVQVVPSTRVDTRAIDGQTGLWTLNSGSVTVGAVGSGDTKQTLNDITLNQNLTTTAILLNATDGDLMVNAPIAWGSANDLTLSASGSTHINSTVRSTANNAHLKVSAGDRIFINRSMLVAGRNGRLTLDAPNGHELSDNVSITLSGSAATFNANGQEYAVVQNASQLQKISRRLNGHYVLGNSIGDQKHFNAIGSEATPFAGTLDGLGHTLSDFSISGNGSLGLFGASSGTIKNVALKSVSVTGSHNSLAGVSIGSLVGRNTGTLYNVQSWGTTVLGSSSRDNAIGGLVGTNFGGHIERAAVSGNVHTNNFTRAAGGLVGENLESPSKRGRIAASSSSATVSGQMQRSFTNGMGGLVGVNKFSDIEDSSARGKTEVGSDGINVGGLVGSNIYGLIERSQAHGIVHGGKYGATGGLLGVAIGGTIQNSSATNTVRAYGAGNTGGAVGINSERGEIINVSASGHVADWSGQNVGGLVGANYGSGALISQGYSAGQVDARNSAKGSNVGGFVGHNSGVIHDSESRAEVDAGQGTYAGGFAGFNEGRLIRVSAGGKVKAHNYSSVGGLVGANSGVIDTAHVSSNVWGAYQSRIGGIAGVNLLHGEIHYATSIGSVDGGIHTTLGGVAGLNQGLLEKTTASGHMEANWYSWLLGQTRGAVTGSNTGIVR